MAKPNKIIFNPLKISLVFFIFIFLFGGVVLKAWADDSTTTVVVNTTPPTTDTTSTTTDDTTVTTPPVASPVTLTSISITTPATNLT